jgi:hypothetical protein
LQLHTRKRVDPLPLLGFRYPLLHRNASYFRLLHGPGSSSKGATMQCTTMHCGQDNGRFTVGVEPYDAVKRPSYHEVIATCRDTSTSTGTGYRVPVPVCWRLGACCTVPVHSDGSYRTGVGFDSIASEYRYSLRYY